MTNTVENNSEPKAKENGGRRMLIIIVAGGFMLASAALLIAYAKFSVPEVKQKKASAPAVVKKENVESVAERIKAAQAKILEEKKRNAADDEQKRRQAEIEAASDSTKGAAAPAGDPAKRPATPASDPAKRASAPASSPAATAPGGQAQKQQTPAERRLSGDVFMTVARRHSGDGGAQPPARSAAPAAAQAVPAGLPALPALSGDAGKSELSDRLRPTELRARQAAKVGNQDYLLPQGVSIGCVLMTAIDTTLPGVVGCRVIDDVLSANGRLVLIDKGAVVFGEVNGQLKDGQGRVFVLWSRITTSAGVTIAVDSPAGDAAGASGVVVDVDRHLGARYGAALLLSTYQDASAALFRGRDGSQGGGVVVANTTKATDNIVSEALKGADKIPPTGRAEAGTVVQVLVARNLDFGAVYGLR